MLLTPLLLARRVRYGPRKFIKDVGRTVYEWVEEVRTTKIKDLLEEPTHVKEQLLHDFTKPETIKDFDLVTDTDSGGKSEAELKMSKNGRIMFCGKLSTTFSDDETYCEAGFAGIKSKERRGRFNKVECVDPSNDFGVCSAAIEIKYRGDGRIYNINLEPSSRAMIMPMKGDLLQAGLYTRGGPYWHVRRIPLSWFNVSYLGFLQDKQWLLSRFKTVGISINDGLPGPFQLELEYIKLVPLEKMPARFSRIDPFGVVVDKDQDPKQVKYGKKGRQKLK